MAARDIVNDDAFQRARAARFWKNVDTSGGYDACWPWLGTKLPGGYGAVTFLGKRTTAHRIAYQLDRGEEIPDGIDGLHNCDNPPCCNPRHIFIGTQKDNIADMHEKGRAGDTRNFGENHGRAKLTDTQVEEIRLLYRAVGHTQATLADMFNIGPSQISRIIQGLSRTHDTPVLRGKQAPHVTLTDAEVAEIRLLGGQGRRRMQGYWSERRLAEKFGVGRSQIHRILAGESR